MSEQAFEQVRSLLAALSFTVGIAALLFLLRRSRQSLVKAKAVLALRPEEERTRIEESLEATELKAQLARRRNSISLTRGLPLSPQQREVLEKLSAVQQAAIGGGARP